MSATPATPPAAWLPTRLARLAAFSLFLGATSVGVFSATQRGPVTDAGSPVAATTATGRPWTDGVVEHLQGRVRQRLDAGYLYLEVEVPTGNTRWVVSLMKDIPVGADVDVTVLGSRPDFWSRRLARRFDTLAFGVVRLRPALPSDLPSDLPSTP